MPLPNYYYPVNYPAQQPIVNQNASQVYNNNSINWVQGENAAKSYPVAPGGSVLLMDSEESVFYIKSTDQSGMPLPLRTFDYSERKSEPHNTVGAKTASVDYVSRSEFDAFREDITKTIKGIRAPKTEKAGENDAKSFV